MTRERKDRGVGFETVNWDWPNGISTSDIQSELATIYVGRNSISLEDNKRLLDMLGLC
jgi:hypothetical protein